MSNPIERIAGGLVVSCQAERDSPLDNPTIIAAMARAAELGGAIGLRVDTPNNIRATRSVSTLPIIGIQKVWDEAPTPFITPRFEDAVGIAAAGADIIAVEAINRARPGNEALEDLIKRIHTELSLPVMADVDSLATGLMAASAGADLLATTLSGYTSNQPTPEGPDITLVRQLVAAQGVPIVAEGRVWTREDAGELIKAGAYAVVVGTAITNPTRITQRLAGGVFEANRARRASS